MELHAFDGVIAVPQAHDLAVLRLSGDFEAGGQRVAFYRERVVTRCAEFGGQSAKHALAVMAHR